MDSIAWKEKRRNYKPTDSCIVCAGRQERRKEGMPHGMFERVKNKLYSTLAILCISGLIFGCAEQTKEPAAEPESQEEEITEPEPLVIESTKWKPHGVYEGTIVISGEGIEDIGYEGIMYIEPDGKYIRISCTDAVRSRYGELF